MYRVQVYKIKRGFWGPKKRVVMDEIFGSRESALNAMKPYQNDDSYAITVIDNTAYYQ